MKILLEIRKKLKARKPTFLRTDSNRKKYKNNWRKPRGLHNKRRLKFKGHQKNPSQGYRSPVEVRGLHTSGLELVTINNLNDIKNIKENQIIEIASNVGTKNKIKMLEECKSKGLQVSNVKDIDKFIVDVKIKLELNKKQKTKKVEEKKKAKASSIKKAEEKKKEEGTKEETQEEIKEEIMHAKPKKVEQLKEAEPKRDSTEAKSGHFQSSIPGTRK